MKKQAILYSLFFSCFIVIKAQTSVSFQHLGNTTFQNNLLNPALIPEGKFFLGLPGLSGVHVNVNSKLSYNKTFRKEGNTVFIDTTSILNTLQNQNFLSTQANVNLLHIGYKFNSGALLSLTVNNRVEADFLFSEEIIDFVVEGNIVHADKDIDISKVGVLASHYREFGLGLALPVSDRLTVGLRAKYLMGFNNFNTPSPEKATLRSNGEAFQISTTTKNVELQSLGIENPADVNYFITENTGFSFDLGGSYNLTPNQTVHLSFTDIGFINWKENIENRKVSDTSIYFFGLDRIAIEEETITSLVDSLSTIFKVTENKNEYRTWLPITMRANWVYHFTPKTDVYVTVGSRYIYRQFKMLYGVGITKKFGKAFTGSVSVTKLPQQFLNLGASIAVKGGPVQLYLAVDQAANFSLTTIQSIDFRFGINLVFQGRKSREAAAYLAKSTTKGLKGYDTHFFLGKEVKTKKRDGIYSIIKRQKRRKFDEIIQTLSRGGIQKSKKVKKKNNKKKRLKRKR